MHKRYAHPRIRSEKSFETSALACAKTSPPPPGSWHFGSPYDTFTGHFGFSVAQNSQSGSMGIGFGPGGTSLSYMHSILCPGWVLYNS
jgi:hypothetical protein